MTPEEKEIHNNLIESLTDYAVSAAVDFKRGLMNKDDIRDVLGGLINAATIRP